MNFEVLHSQFPQLDGKVYADWTGSAIAPRFLIDKWHRSMCENLLGNPHSHHEPSRLAMERIMETRVAVLKFFRADPSEYEVIFTSGATAAIRIMQHFMFEGGELLLTADNHNSVNGLREDAKRQGGIVRYAPIKPDLTLDVEALRRMLTHPRSQGNRLFAYPGKSNYSGTTHSWNLVTFAQEHGWSVLLDAAAYSSNQRLDLSVVKPEFVPISFYKMFGQPTGVGALLIKKSAYAKLHKRWFAGGSILLVSVMMDFHAPESLGYARFEDGTVNFGCIPAITPGLEFVEGLGNIYELATELYDGLRESDDVILYSPRGTDIVTFNIKEGNGQRITEAERFEDFASKRGVFVRTGCFCNPGSNEMALGYEIESFVGLYNDAIQADAVTIDNLRRFGPPNMPIGAIRASFGYANRQGDPARFLEVVHEFLQTLS